MPQNTQFPVIAESLTENFQGINAIATCSGRKDRLPGVPRTNPDYEILFQ